MTKKHFRDLAFTTGRGLSGAKIEGEAYEIIVEEIAAFCGRHNPNFDKARFCEAVRKSYVLANHGIVEG